MKREEAIERIKSRYDKWALDDKDLEAIQCTFPELTESEDEKIRGCIGVILTDATEQRFTDFGVSLKDCLAWLEKQKEKKLTEDWKETRKKECPFRKEDSCKRYADVVCECTGNCSWVVDYPKLKEIQDRKEQKLNIELIQRSWYMEGYHDREFNMEPKWTIKAKKGGPRYEENPRYGQSLTEEQKPADEQFPPLEGLDAIKAKYYDDGFKNGFDSGVESVKPAEWSEEDEKKIRRLRSILNRLAVYDDALDVNGDYCDGDYAELDDWLKSLRLQPKQNANDIITPNKRFFKWIYGRLVNVHKENPNVDYMISFKKRIEELSFDEPHLKINKEQMDALKNVAYGYYQNSDMPLLHELHEQLKKLM